MSRITDIFLVNTAEQKAITIRSKASVSEISTIISESFIKLEEYIKSKDIEASDTPFLQIDTTSSNFIEFTVGITVPKTVYGNDEIENYLIPAGKKIFCYWQGTYSDMSPLYKEMQSFAKNLGYEVEKDFFEYYLNDLTYGDDKLLTKVVMLVK